MARNPRPIDPTEGPLQAFAVELRRLRETAGDPTYRAMSVRAGFSATTLSEAAGGVRKPSLDVTLAFVEVCGGDQAEWRTRWARMDRALTAQQAGPEAERQTTGGISAVEGTGFLDENEDEDGNGVENEEGDEYESESEDGGGRGGGREGRQYAAAAAHSTWPAAVPAKAGEAAAVAATEAGADVIGEGPRRSLWGGKSASGRFPMVRRGALLVCVAVLVAGAVMVVPHLLQVGRSAPEAAPRAASSGAEACPSMASADAAFSGETYQDGTHVRSGASLDAPEVAQLPAQCALSFSGYCLGQSLRDQKSGSPDMRWFKLLDGSGVVASAVIHGNPPQDLSPTACPQDAPPPAVVHLHVAAAKDVQDADVLSATGIDAPIVGYAAYYSDEQEAVTHAPNWHEIGLIDPAYDPVPEWRLAGVSAAISGLPGTPSGTVPVVAVACFGGGAPTQVFDAVAIRAGHPTQTMAVQLTAPDLAAAERAACQYPTTG